MSVEPTPARDTEYPWGDKPTLYEEIGGDSAVRNLVDAFYDEIDATAPELRAMHPRDDVGSRLNLYEFLSGWTGGPSLYIERKGHPRLRMRHFPFQIGEFEATEWIRCMHTALDQVIPQEQARQFLKTQLASSAHHVRNE